jgi:hypothetical protein
VYFYLHMNMYFCYKFHTNPQHFPTRVNTINKGHFHKLTSNLLFSESCLLLWH